MTQFTLTTLTVYDDKAIIDEIIRVSSITEPGLKLSRRIFNKYSKVHASTITKRFGSWERALELAGLLDRFDSSNKKISRDEMIGELKRVSTQLKIKILKRDDFC